MADDDKTTEETAEAPAAEAPAENSDTASSTDSPQGSESASTADAPGSTDDETAPESEATRGASSPDAAPSAAPQAPQALAEPQVQLAPKERRVQARAAKAAKRPAGGPRTAEERQADRDVKRAKAATERRARRAKETVKHKAEAHNRVATPAREHVEGQQKVRQGVVVSDKADKTITVRIDVARRHRRYSKIVRTSRTLHAHDEANDAHIGDTVTVRECRPLSRLKRWRLIGVVERAK
jgi:small subunit ribosomal protein S17